MLKEFVKTRLRDAWHQLGLPVVTIHMQAPDQPEFGDFATSLALTGAKEAHMSPRDLATRLLEKINEQDFCRVEIAGPGFINFTLEPRLIHKALDQLLHNKNRFGCSHVGAGRSLQVEFVSSNPTGPLTVGHGRQAVLGDVLASLYDCIGYEITREYYFNDEGRQTDLLAHSLWARYRQQLGEEKQIPDGGYEGDYLIDIARDCANEYGNRFPEFSSDAQITFRNTGVKRITKMIRDDLDKLEIQFDNWFSERDLHQAGKVDAALSNLRERNGVYEKDSAIWLKAEQYGGEKDSVLIRSDGRPTYLMVDIAYHIDKYNRGFEQILNVQGADHQAEQSCMQAALRILDLPKDFLRYAVHQFVSIKEDGQTVRMSTRKGKFVLLGDLVNELGSDIVRYFMVARKPSSHLDFDLDLAREESLDNPVYYIQYAHTRIASIFRKVEETFGVTSEVNLAPLTGRIELNLIKELDRFPDIVEQAALGFSPHMLTDYAHGLARTFHAYYDSCRVLGEHEPTTQARLSLLAGVQTVLQRCLEILGMSIPEKM